MLATTAISVVSIAITFCIVVAFFGLADWNWWYAAIPTICAILVAPWFFHLILGLLDAVSALSEDYRRLAEEDQLTGLLNRRGLFEHGRDWPAGAWVLLADIDDFKQVNDLGGHEQGDRALVTAAEALRALVGPTALLARTGGDEFVALIDADFRPPTTQSPLIVDTHQSLGSPEQLRLSLGWVRHGQGLTLDESLARADVAMYRAKGSDRTR